MLWFFGKVFFFIFVFIWLRGSLPRLRYDQFMAFGWKRLIPIVAAWIIAVATIRAISLEGGFDRQYSSIGSAWSPVLFLLLFFVGAPRTEETGRRTPTGARVRRRLPGPADAGRRGRPRRCRTAGVRR